MSILEVKNLTKFYGDFKALDDVNLRVKKNEVYGFIGRNGAGKTTTINSILSLIEYQSGEILFDGKKVSKLTMHDKRDIGYVPDVPSFPRYLNAREFLGFVYDAYQLPVDKKNETIKATLSRVQLEDNLKKISGYSRGMKQRLAIAQALIHKPKLLLMDEPTSALDPIGRKDIIDIIRELKKDLTILYSTHILEDAQKVCDTIGLIEGGKMLFEKPLKTVISDKQQAYYIRTDQGIDETLSMVKASNLVFDEHTYNEGIVYTLKDASKSVEFQRYLAEKNIGITHLQLYEKSLEDVFVEVLNENNR